MFALSRKLASLPPYLFAQIDQAKRKARAEGRDIIDLGVGDPDLPTPDYIIEKLYQAALDPANHRYALDQGMPALRQAIARWYYRRFKIKLNPDTEILPLVGSKEGIAHLPLAFLNTGDYSLVPDPCYPPYKGGTILAGGRVYLMPLLEGNGFLPDLSRIPPAMRRKAKMLYINYPNNPTSATAEKRFYDEVSAFAGKNRMIVVSDLAYSEMSYDGYRPTSFLEAKGGREVGIEFHSLSKTYNMTGWRVGWACGNSELIAALSKVKSNIDSGIFSAIQIAAIAALEGPQDTVEDMRQVYQARRNTLIRGLKELGWDVRPAKATFYAWLKIPCSRGAGAYRKQFGSLGFASFLLDKADIIVTPGVGFGKYGEGYIRMALTVDKKKIQEAVKRLRKIL